ncbi:MAG TPA: GNAT family N-acetyltransferase [Gemmatales bacterium]|nr:GNAT family N-acetyltransferase [Gemmatales bacterium]HMP58856.1 GNAT family N-acetyltransferase [Gemmatales bacterium]
MLELKTTTYQRVRMELELRGRQFLPRLADEFFFIPWEESLLAIHAEVHYRAFSDCVDAELFPSFRERSGCYYLMRELRAKPGFLPTATWLVASAAGCCGGIQCADEGGVGMIQNVGVMPGYRSLGLGRALVEQALASLQAGGYLRGALEATQENERAIILYRRLGFRVISQTPRTVTQF